VEGRGSWPNLRSYIGICLEGLRKTTINFSQYSPSPGRQRRLISEDNIKMNLRKIRFEGMDWIYLARDRIDRVR
jgi:hypothetical protein